MSLYSVVAKISLLASIACLGLAYVLAGDWFIVSFFLVMAAILFFLKKKFQFWANSGMLFLCVFLATLGLMKDLSLPLMVLGCTASLASWDLAHFGQSIRDQKILAESQSKASQIVREASERAEAKGREVIVAAEVEAAKKREEALAEIDRERERILGEMRGQVGALAIAATQKLIGASLDEERQHSLIDEFFSGVKSGKVVVLEGEMVTGVSAEVTSALPLTAGEKEVVKKDVLSQIGEQATVTFRVDPAILGGLVIRVGDKVLDGSVASQLESSRQSLY